MRQITIVLALLVGMTGLVQGKVNRVELTDQNFDQMVTRGDWLILFTSDKCRFCIDFRPEFQSFVESGATLPDMYASQVDLASNPSLVGRFFVMRVPGLYHYDANAKELRVLDSYLSAAKLVEYFRDGKKNQVQPRPSYFEPFSVLAIAMGHFGSCSSLMGSHAHKVYSLVADKVEFARHKYLPGYLDQCLEYRIHAAVVLTVLIGLAVLRRRFKKKRD